MKSRPILFSTPMVKAVLAGTKTITRRVIKPQPKPLSGGWMYNGKYFTSDKTMQDHLFHEVYGEKGSPYGSAYADGTGDTLWVRETWAKHCIGGEDYVFYRADSIPDGDGAPWKPSIFMPRALSRITLEIVDVRVERLQEITAEDAQAEGVKAPILNKWNDGQKWIGQFRGVWDDINAARGYSWDDNPFVWVIEFERVQA